MAQDNEQDKQTPPEPDATAQQDVEQTGAEEQNQSTDQAESQSTADADASVEADVEVVPELERDEEMAKLRDQTLRSLAEVENVKRRASKDVENAHKFAVERLINNLFPVLDSLEKAVETAQETEGADALAEGVQLSLKLFLESLVKSGVAQIDPLGEPFDPQLHEAIAMVPNPDAEPNSVMEVMATGYTLNGRLVRAAKVIVVKGE